MCYGVATRITVTRPDGRHITGSIDADLFCGPEPGDTRRLSADGP